MSQSRFIKVLRQPEEVGFCLIVLPKGHKASADSLMTCKPNGMPIIVTQSKRPEITYSAAMKIPPKMSQIMLPKNFIIILIFRFE